MTLFEGRFPQLQEWPSPYLKGPWLTAPRRFDRGRGFPGVYGVAFKIVSLVYYPWPREIHGPVAQPAG
jgi:hypothetical protein